jgi:heme oxygenase
VAKSIAMNMDDTSTHCTLFTSMYSICLTSLPFGNALKQKNLLYIYLFISFYSSMEGLLEKYKEHPTVKLIYFPTEVNRKQSLLNGNAKF